LRIRSLISLVAVAAVIAAPVASQARRRAADSGDHLANGRASFIGKSDQQSLQLLEHA